MSRKNKKYQIFEEVQIADIGAEGKALARVDDKVVFVPYAIPGDIVDLQVTKSRKKYMEANVIKTHSYSKDRVEAFCQYFGICGGCKWQNLPYDKQLYFKQKQVFDQLTRIGKIEIPEISPIIGSIENINYRNKLEFTFSNKRWLTKEEVNSKMDFSGEGAVGFHIPGLFDKVINIKKCWLQPEPSNEIRNFIYKYASTNHFDFFDIRNQQGFLRNLIIRTSTTGEVMVILLFFRENKRDRENLLNAVLEKFPQISTLLYVINKKGNDTIIDQEVIVFSGKGFIWEEMEGLKFKISPKSFYQTNSLQAYELYKVVRSFAGLKGNEIVYDLYTGTGTIANFISKDVKKVIGIEFVPEAVEDAKFNARENNIENIHFFTGDIKNILNHGFIKEQGFPDIIITDPPRAGMHNDVVKTIENISPGKIIYVSCNPATQARDIFLLSSSYKVIKIQPVDMFPHTHHVENVVLLEKHL